MIKSVKARTPILALILFMFAVGNVFAETKVVVIPMGADAAPQSMAMYADGDQIESITTTDESVREIVFIAPSDGVVIVNSSAYIGESTAGDAVECSIVTGTTVLLSHVQKWESPGSTSGGGAASLSGTRGFDVAKGNSYTFKLVCRHSGTSSSSNVFDSSLTAIFTPSA